MIHTVIVPGVGGSEHDHWQSWLQRQLKSCSRVQQQDWNKPVLHEWIEKFVKTVQSIQEPIQIVAHSFGCLTTVAALAQHPELNQKIKNLVLVAPASWRGVCSAHGDALQPVPGLSPAAGRGFRGPRDRSR